MNKGQAYVNHFKETGLNQTFNYNSKMLDIPKGSDENVRILDSRSEEVESRNEEVNENMEKTLRQLTSILYYEQQNKFMSHGTCLAVIAK
mmetsp:Transcript_15860/g.18364  ORF Transcript_15860/g.18364 Transcript_15860/m.18364 type:complete len:90 (-) Transcript_15860:34-303(-)